MNFIENSTLTGLMPLLNEQVNFSDGTTVPLGHFPLIHILFIAQQCERDVRDLIERLENDGVKPDQLGGILSLYEVTTVIL